MMKLWTDRNGNVYTKCSGSMEQQDTDAMLIAMYLQDRAEYKAKVARCVLQNKRANEQDEPDEIGGTD